MSTSLTRVHSTDIGQLRESLADWARQRLGESVLVLAKDAFSRVNGAVFPDDPFFDARMTYFLDMFLFEQRASQWPEDQRPRTPYEDFYWSHTPTTDARRVDVFRHSLFKVTSVSRERLMIVDLITSHKHEITPDANGYFAGIARNDLFQGFIYTIGDTTTVSRGLIFHPREASRVIIRDLARSKNSTRFDEKSWLSRLARQQVRHLRHAHVQPQLIYGMDPP